MALPSTISEWTNDAALKTIVEETLALAKQQGATQAEVCVSENVGMSVTVRLGEIETIEYHRDKSLDLTVYVGKRKGSSSSTDLSTAAMQQVVQSSLLVAQHTEEDPYAGLAEENLMAKTIVPLDLYHPWTLSVEEAIAIAQRSEGSAFATDKRIVNSEGASVNSGQQMFMYGNSHGFVAGYPSAQHSVSCCVLAEDENGMEREYEYTYGRLHEKLIAAEIIGQGAAKKALARLGARKLPTQKVPVIFHHEIAGGLLGHYLSAIAGSRLYRKTSFLENSLGKQILNPIVNMSENPLLLQGLHSAPFDSDGLQTRAQVLVDAGRVNQYLLGVYSARQLGLQSTANSGGARNVMVKPTTGALDELLKTMGTGLLVTDVMGPGVNLLTGDYSRGANGFWVENGQIQYPVHEITIAGHLKDMFMQIQAIGNDFETRGNIQTGSVLIESMMVAGS